MAKQDPRDAGAPDNTSDSRVSEQVNLLERNAERNPASAPFNGRDRGMIKMKSRAAERRTVRQEVDWRDLVQETRVITLTPSELCEAHIRELAASNSPSLADWQSYHRHWLSDFGQIPLREHSQQMWEAWLRARVLDPVPLAPATVNRKLAMASGLYNLALRYGALDTNPIRLIPKDMRPQRRPINPVKAGWSVLRVVDIAAVTAAGRAGDACDFFSLLLFAGALLLGGRVGELSALRRRDWSVGSGATLGAVHVKVQWHGKSRCLRATKDKTDKIIPVHPRLAELLALVPRRFHSLTDRLPTLDDPLFPFFPRLRTGNCSGEVRRWNQRTALEHWKAAQLGGLVPMAPDGLRTFHSLRHTFITRLYAAQAHPLAVRALTHPATVRSQGRDAHLGYVHVDFEMLCGAVLKLNLSKEVQPATQGDLFGVNRP